jgi:fucose 4-O-acetylase-like acetyltransferase
VVVVFIRIFLLVCVQITLDKHISRNKLVLAGTFFSVCSFDLRESCGS